MPQTEHVRKILHVDMDAFYASIEQRDRPHLRGRPVAVGGRPETRGVVAAASYEARRFGVRSAMPSRVALRRCPDLAFLPPDFGRYRQVSRQLHDILDRFSDVIEPLALDEAYLDVTHDKAGLGSATAVAQAIRAAVRDTLHLTCSVGVAPVKFVAKIASDHHKPDGLTVIRPEQVLGFIRPLPVEALWGVGPATLDRLHVLGVRTVADLAALSEDRLTLALGSRGRLLWQLAQGEDPRPVQADRIRRSRSAERTFAEDVTDREVLLTVLRDQVEEVVASVKAAHDRGRTVTLKLRYADFTTVTRAMTLEAPTDQASAVLDAAVELLERTEAGERPVRLIGVGLSNFLSEPARGAESQLDLPWGEP